MRRSQLTPRNTKNPPSLGSHGHGTVIPRSFSTATVVDGLKSDSTLEGSSTDSNPSQHFSTWELYAKILFAKQAFLALSPRTMRLLEGRAIGHSLLWPPVVRTSSTGLVYHSISHVTEVDCILIYFLAHKSPKEKWRFRNEKKSRNVRPFLASFAPFLLHLRPKTHATTPCFAFTDKLSRLTFLDGLQTRNNEHVIKKWSACPSTRSCRCRTLDCIYRGQCRRLFRCTNEAQCCGERANRSRFKNRRCGLQVQWHATLSPQFRLHRRRMDITHVYCVGEV